MELNPRTADGDMHSPEQVRQQVEHARQQAAFYEARRQELEQNNEQKELFSETLEETGCKLHNAVRRLEKELNSMTREQQEVGLAYECLKRHLEILSALQPKTWSTEGFSERLRDAIPKVQRAENDFNETFRCGHMYQHTQVFRYKPGIEDTPQHKRKMIWEEMQRGLFFHLPLFLLLLLSWAFYQLITL